MAYQVTAESVTVEMNVGPGRARVDVYHGATLPDDVPAEDVDRLLALGHIENAEAVESDPKPERKPRSKSA